MLTTDTHAPDFTLQDQNEVTHSLHQYAGKWVLLYFYPKDDTPGCTKEACTIAEVYDDFQAKDVVVLGVSKDSPQSHKKFAEKYSLPFTLLSDPNREVIELYGAEKDTKLFGKIGLGTKRISYLISPDMQIAKVYPDVDPATHAAQLLQDIAAQQ